MSIDAPARTSLLIAVATLLEVGDESGLESRLTHAALIRAGAPGLRLLWLSQRGLGRTLLRALESIMLPGLARHYRWRKRRIAGWAEDQIAQGVEQVVVLGAGFDVLACNLARRHQTLTAIEIDRAAPSALKRSILGDLGAMPPNLHGCAGDLAREPLAAILARCAAFDSRRPTLIVAEGVLMYLAPDEVWRLMCAFAHLMSAPVALIATAMTRRDNGRIGFEFESRGVRHWLKRHGEPFRWGATAEALPDTLRELRIRLEAIADPRIADDPDPCPGEWLFRGRVDAKKPLISVEP